MIIDENSFNNKIKSNNSFQSNNNFNNRRKNVFTKDINQFNHTNPTNSNDMSDKSLAMLHERLEKNLISPEEFNRKCQELAEKRNH